VYPITEPIVVYASPEQERANVKASRNHLTVATYNVLNLDPNDEDGDADIADGRFDTIATQIVYNLRSPDILALQEIQDNDGSVVSDETSADLTLQTLIAAIVAAGGPAYQFADTEGLVPNSVGGQPGGNIRVAYLYNPERVTLLDYAPLTDPVDQATNPDNPFYGSRIPLSASFEFNKRQVFVINNHLSSKGGSAPIMGVEQPFDQRQEDVTVNGSLDERQRQATAVADVVSGLLAEDEDANIVVLGDLNEFEFVSPVKDILGAGLTNTTDSLPPNERYTFIFQGNSQSLDHILLSDSLVKHSKVDIVHFNVEYAATAQRSSDHDPVVVRLKLKPPKGNGRK
jgi:predicted extracellular nuclease